MQCARRDSLSGEMMYTDCATATVYFPLYTTKLLKLTQSRDKKFLLAVMERQYLYIFCLIIFLVISHSLLECANVLVMDGFYVLYKKQTKLILKVIQTHTIYTVHCGHFFRPKKRTKIGTSLGPDTG